MVRRSAAEALEEGLDLHRIDRIPLDLHVTTDGGQGRETGEARERTGVFEEQAAADRCQALEPGEVAQRGVALEIKVSGGLRDLSMLTRGQRTRPFAMPSRVGLPRFKGHLRHAAGTPLRRWAAASRLAGGE